MRLTAVEIETAEDLRDLFNGVAPYGLFFELKAFGTRFRMLTSERRLEILAAAHFQEKEVRHWKK